MGNINEHIIRDFSVGQEKAFRILYEKYAPALRYFAAKYVEEGEVIDDIVQDVFVCLWEKRVDFKTEETIKAFLYKAVKNSCLNTIRHQGVKDRYAEVALHEEELESFWDHILETELFELLLGVFNEGKKHEEIAEILQITVNTVKKHKNNANHYMRERLKHILSLLVLCQFP